MRNVNIFTRATWQLLPFFLKNCQRTPWCGSFPFSLTLLKMLVIWTLLGHTIIRTTRKPFLSHGETSLRSSRVHYLLWKPCLRNRPSSQRANYGLSGCASPTFTLWPVWLSCLLLLDGCSHDYRFQLRRLWQRHQNTDWWSCKSTPTIAPRRS